MGDSQGFQPLPKGYATTAIHHYQEPEKWSSMAVVTPIVTSTTFKQYGPANFKKYFYARFGNPTREVLENVLAKLDNAKYGLVFSSGSGGQATILSMFKTGDNIIIGDDIYGGTTLLFTELASNFNIDLTIVDVTDTKALEKSIKPNTKMVWIESPTNPTVKVVDIKATAEVCKRHKVLLAVDNTFLTSYLQRPLELGADIVAYSLSKYMNGHSDVVMGAVTTSNKEVYEKLTFLQETMGVVPSPMDCYQVNRSLKTLALRMQQHMKNSLMVANYLEKHPKILKVLHPALPSHPQYELAKKQASGHSGTFAFYIKGGIKETEAFLSYLKVFTLAESLGGYESLAEVPCLMTHATVPEDIRQSLGITDNLIRFSVGLEDAEDLIEDLKQALEKL